MEKTAALPSGGTAAGTRRRRIRWGDILAPYLFILPFILSFLALFVGPAAYSLVLSFFRYKGYGAARFVGFANYQAILGYHEFWTMLKNNAFYWLAHVLPLMIFAFLLAVLVRSNLVKWKSFYKPIIFIPDIVAVVAASLIFQSFFGTQYGVINKLLGIQVPWLQDTVLRRWVVTLLLVWRGVGWWFVVYLAGLTSINPDLDEAALVDGASVWQRLRFVTVPLMRNTFLFVIVIDAIGSARLFTEPNVLVATGSMLAHPDMAPVLNLLVNNLRDARFGRSAAVGWLIFVIAAAISYLQFRILRGVSEEA